MYAPGAKTPFDQLSYQVAKSVRLSVRLFVRRSSQGSNIL